MQAARSIAECSSGSAGLAKPLEEEKAGAMSLEHGGDVPLGRGLLAQQVATSRTLARLL